MKKILLTVLSAFIYISCMAQAPGDTAILDTSEVERIKRMPVDTTNSKMPVAPLQGTPKGNTRDDVDPKMRKDSLRYRNEH
jgi:hypothetical protein